MWGSFDKLSDLILDLSPDNIKLALVREFKTESELTLAQAHLLYRLKNTMSFDYSIWDYFRQHQIKIEHMWEPVMDFAVQVLGIEASRYKWLKRISENLPYLTGPSLRGKIHLTSAGFLEKLSYLSTALKKHVDNYGLVIDAFNTVSAKRFREFARNKWDNLSRDPITLKDYQKAKPFIDKLHSFQAQGKSVTVIGLQSENEQEWLEKINKDMQGGEKYFKNSYPNIVWDSNFQVEVASV
jgi:hypothetical protein